MAWYEHHVIVLLYARPALWSRRGGLRRGQSAGVSGTAFRSIRCVLLSLDAFSCAIILNALTGAGSKVIQVERDVGNGRWQVLISGTSRRLHVKRENLIKHFRTYLNDFY